MRKFLLFSIALLFATLVSGQTLSRPQIAYPFDGNVLQGPLKTVRQTPQVTRTPDAFAPSTISAGGDRLVATQNSDGGWGWYLTGISANNTIGPIAKGLIQAYTGKYSSTQLAAFTKTKTFLLNKTNTFSATDGYLAKALDDIFGGTTCRDHVNTYYFGPLAAGTYNRNGEGTLYSTSSYVSYVLTSSGNLPGWYLGISLAGAVDCGVTGTELGYWISGVKTSI